MQLNEQVVVCRILSYLITVTCNNFKRDKRVSFKDGQPKCVGGINILSKISFIVKLKR